MNAYLHHHARVQPQIRVVEGDANRQALGDLGEVAAGVGVREQRIARGGGAADALHLAGVARIRVRVTDLTDGRAIRGAQVDLLSAESAVQCVNCPTMTNANGRAILRLRGLPRTEAREVTVTATGAGFAPAQVSVSVAGVATASVTLGMSALP